MVFFHHAGASKAGIEPVADLITDGKRFQMES